MTNRVIVLLLLFVCWTILGTSVDQTWFQSDHLEPDITTLGLDETKLSQIRTILSHPLLQKDTLLQIANHTGMSVTPHLVYRYLESMVRQVPWQTSRRSHSRNHGMATFFWDYPYQYHSHYTVDTERFGLSLGL